MNLMPDFFHHDAAPPPPVHINPRHANDVQYWTEKWKVTAWELRAAVEAVGTLETDVRRYLGR